MAICGTSPVQRSSGLALPNYRLIKVKQLGSRFFRGKFLVPGRQSCSSIQYRPRKCAVHVRSFLPDCLEGGTAELDKHKPEIPQGTAGHWPLMSTVSQQQHKQAEHASISNPVLCEAVIVKPVAGSQETVSKSLVELPAAKQIVQLLTAWDSLSEKIPPEVLKCKGSQLLLSALKIAIPAFQRHPFSEDGRFQLSRALEVAYTLADLRMDAEAIAAGILRVAMDTRAISVADVQRELGAGTVHLLHDCIRVNKMPSRFDSLEDGPASIIRQFSLAYHDLRALTVELATRLDSMRHIFSLPQHLQQVVALENMQVYAPLAHALGLGHLSQELEDLAFKVLFPDSYQYVGDWLRYHWGDGEAIITDSLEKLREALERDSELQLLTDSIQVTGRCKSRFSLMRKLLKDGRRPDQVYDILGLRVILSPKTGAKESNGQCGLRACYRAQTVITRMWSEVAGRFKDYIAKPKDNGYQSLHLTVYLTEYGAWSLPMELQIRTTAMHAHAVAGTAAHALYKGGLTDPQQVKHFKAVMLAAANASAYRFQNAGCSNDHIFDMFDQNKDGVISREEFENVMVELGADKADAYKVVELVDSNTDGSVDMEELAELQRQVRALHSGLNSKYSQANKNSGSTIELKQVSVF